MADKGLEEVFVESFVIDDPVERQLVYQRPFEGVLRESTVSNSFGFHGLSRDAESGLYYARHRYYDVEMGRFVTSDPLGYVDGPSMYGFAGNDPVNFGDPLGLYMADVHFYAIYYLSRTAGFTAGESHEIAFASQYVDNSAELNPDPFSDGGFKRYATEREDLAEVHFAPGTRAPVKENNRFARAGVTLAGRSGSLTRLGVALHTYADSFSHATFSLYWSPGNKRKEGHLPGFGHADSGHGAHGADLPDLEQGKAMRMSWGALELLQTALRDLGRSPRAPDLEKAKRDISSAFALEYEDEEGRSSYWKTLIELRFGEIVDYSADSAAPPAGWFNAIQQHLGAIKAMKVGTISTYQFGQED